MRVSIRYQIKEAITMNQIIFRRSERWTDCMPYDGYEITENGKRPISSLEILDFLKNQHTESKYNHGFVLATRN